MKKLIEDKDWEGKADDLATRVTFWLREKVIADNGQEPNVRLVRDYVARGILTRPQRRGKEAIFNFRHLVEFLACRAMITDGWPLLKISEDFQQSSLDEILRLIPGEQPENSSLELIHSFKKSNRIETVPGNIKRHSISQEKLRVSDTKTAYRSNDLKHNITEESESFLSRRRHSYEYKSDIKDVLKRLGSELDNIIKEDFTAFQLASWLILFMDTDKAKDITRAEAEDVGKAITAALLNKSSLSSRTKDMYAKQIKTLKELNDKIEDSKRELAKLAEKKTIIQAHSELKEKKFKNNITKPKNEEKKVKRLVQKKDKEDEI